MREKERVSERMDVCVREEAYLHEKYISQKMLILHFKEGMFLPINV